MWSLYCPLEANNVCDFGLQINYNKRNFNICFTLKNKYKRYFTFRFCFLKERLTLANMFRLVDLNTNDLSQLQQSWDGPSITHVHETVCG